MALDFHAVVSSRLVSAGVLWKGNAGLSFWVLPLGFLLFACLSCHLVAFSFALKGCGRDLAKVT